MANERDSIGDAGPVQDLESIFSTVIRQSSGPEIVYVGDPMCSWCWGAAPVVAALSDYCTDRDIVFSVVMGGLRPGGDVAWTREFKVFLHDHWQHVAERTGQPFSDAILKWGHFDYDTEPACRAVVTARGLLASDANSKVLIAFLADTQRKFYVDGKDPKDPAFYWEPCLACGIDYDAFLANFDSVAARERTEDDFRTSRSWGVIGFPSFVVHKEEGWEIAASGFVPLDELITRIERIFGTQNK